MKTIAGLFLAMCACATADPTNTATLNEARFGAGGAAVGPYVYFCAGHGLDEALGSVERLDPATGSVTTLPVRVAARWFLGSAVWRDRIVLAGGIRSGNGHHPGGRTDLVELLDPIGGSVSNLPPLPRERSLPALSVVGDKLYAIGGAVSEGEQSRRTGEVSIFDFNLGTWSEGPPMPTPRECAVAVIGSRIYALGGYDGSNSLAVVEVFDTDAGTWESRPDLPAPQSAHRAVANGNIVYLFGDYRTLIQVAAGNPETGAWRLLDLPFPPSRHSAAARVEDFVVVAGGNMNSSADSALDAVNIFTRGQLESAPSREGPPPPISRATPPMQRPGELMIDGFITRMKGLTNVALRGTWTMSCIVRGQSNEVSDPYILKAQPPDRLYLEIGATRLWYDGATLTLADAAAGYFVQTNVPPPLGTALNQLAYPLLDLLPYGHQALIDPTRAPAIQGAARRMQWMPGSNTLWRGHPATTLVSRGRLHEDGMTRPGYEITVDPDSGITVASTSVPTTPPPSTGDCRSDEQDLLETFRGYLLLDEVDTQTRWPEETFRATIDPTWKSNPHAVFMAMRSPRSNQAVAWLNRYWESQNQRWSPPERPAHWIHLWSARVCADEVRPEYDRYVLNRIPPRMGVMLVGSNLVVRRLADGGEDALLPKPDALPENEQGWSLLAWAQGERPEDDRLAVYWQSEYTNLLLLLDRQGAVRHERSGEEAEVGRLSVLPAGGERREMLALVQGQNLRLMNPQDGQILQVMRLSRERMEITDRDGDRLPEFTFIGRDISCYEWPAKD